MIFFKFVKMESTLYFTKCVFVFNFLKACYPFCNVQLPFHFSNECHWCLLTILKDTKSGLSLSKHEKRPRTTKK